MLLGCEDILLEKIHLVSGFLRIGFSCILASLTLLCGGSTVSAVEKPNVLLYMADDMGMGDTSAYQDFTGNTDALQLDTPSMEKLARMGVRFTDAHTPSSRCTPTRYGLLTGRDPWRTRLKQFVLFGSQGDPLIEADRPTLATLFRSQGYGTAMVGKWHVGLLYSNSEGKPADCWEDADLSQPLLDGPIDHGFDFARFSSRSHGTSAPPSKPGGRGGPGYVHGNRSVTAIGPNSFHWEGRNAFVLEELGGRYCEHASEYLSSHLQKGNNEKRPFFLYFAAHSNHAPYTPVKEIQGTPVKGASKTKSGKPGNARLDFVYENDVILGNLLQWLETHDDPRHPGKKLIDTTIVVFTSDNGAELNKKQFTGPFRSNKASCYEGGHRVPLIVAWGAGGIGDGDVSTPGQTNPTPISLTDMYATFAELLSVPLPDLATGVKGAEDSVSALPSWRGKVADRSSFPMFCNDHKEAKQYGKKKPLRDVVAMSMRLDNPMVKGELVQGQWKIFFAAPLIREGIALPMELYDLASDQREKNNRVKEPKLQPLVEHLTSIALNYRNAGGLRLANLAAGESTSFDWRKTKKASFSANGMTLSVMPVGDQELVFGPEGLGMNGEASGQVEADEALAITCDQDVIVENIRLKAGPRGTCGGFYRVGDGAPLPIYCVDKHAEKYSKMDQSGMLSDIGVLKAGQKLILDSAPHYGANAPGSWHLQSIQVRALTQ